MIPKFSYWLSEQLYLNVTNRLVCKAPIALRGPKFQMPSSSGFSQLPIGFEPNAEQIFNEVDRLVNEGKVKVESMRADAVTFAGNGEPLLCLNEITDAARLIKEARHGLPLRIRTSGLVLAKDAETVAEQLKSSGIKSVTVSLLSDNPKQFHEIVQPTNGAGFGDVCNFVSVCAGLGLQVTCTTMERTDISVAKVRSLSEALGATGFVSYPYFE